MPLVSTLLPVLEDGGVTPDTSVLQQLYADEEVYPDWSVWGIDYEALEQSICTTALITTLEAKLSHLLSMGFLLTALPKGGLYRIWTRSTTTRSASPPLPLLLCWTLLCNVGAFALTLFRTRRMRSIFSSRQFRSRLLFGQILTCLLSLTVESCSVLAIKKLASGTLPSPLWTLLLMAPAALSAWVGRSSTLRQRCTRAALSLSTSVRKRLQPPASSNTTKPNSKWSRQVPRLVGALLTVVGVLVGFRVFQFLTQLRPPLPSLQANSGTPSMEPTAFPDLRSSTATSPQTPDRATPCGPGQRPQDPGLIPRLGCRLRASVPSRPMGLRSSFLQSLCRRW